MMRPVLAVGKDSQQMNCNCSEQLRQNQVEGQREIPAPPFQTSPPNINQKTLTGARAHRGVLDVEESLSVLRHSGGGVGEFAKRQERRLVAIEDGGEGTESRGRARWGGGY